MEGQTTKPKPDSFTGHKRNAKTGTMLKDLPKVFLVSSIVVLCTVIYFDSKDSQRVDLEFRNSKFFQDFKKRTIKGRELNADLQEHLEGNPVQSGARTEHASQTSANETLAAGLTGWAGAVEKLLSRRGPSTLLVAMFDQYDDRFETWNPKGRNAHFSLNPYPIGPARVPMIAKRELFSSDDCPIPDCSQYVLRACFDVVVVGNHSAWTSSLSPTSKTDILDSTLNSERCGRNRVIHWIYANISCDEANVKPQHRGPLSLSNVCHRMEGRDDALTKNSLDWEGSPNFFLIWNGTTTLNEMSMGCIRSIFAVHPACTLRLFSNSLDPKYFEPFRKAGFDLQVKRFDLDELVINTPAEDWFHSNSLTKSKYAKNNLSNILRLLLLYYHGGIYLDFDIIVLSSLRYTKNSVGIQTKSLNNAVLAFEKRHPYVWDAMEDFVANYNGSAWGNNGPQCMTRVYPKTEHPPNLLGPVSYYPVPYKTTRGLFRNVVEPDSPTMQRLKKHALLLHLWNNIAREHEYPLVNGSVAHRVLEPYVSAAALAPVS